MSSFDQAASLGVDHLSRAVETGVPCKKDFESMRGMVSTDRRREEKRKGGRERRKRRLRTEREVGEDE
jgi:hypothetical protein